GGGGGGGGAGGRGGVGREGGARRGARRRGGRQGGPPAEQRPEVEGPRPGPRRRRVLAAVQEDDGAGGGQVGRAVEQGQEGGAGRARRVAPAQGRAHLHGGQPQVRQEDAPRQGPGAAALGRDLEGEGLLEQRVGHGGAPAPPHKRALQQGGEDPPPAPHRGVPGAGPTPPAPPPAHHPA